jgi:mannose-6-phosphate isomerase-like protein (cupin superfamily)
MKLSPEELLKQLPFPADEKWKDGVPFVTAFSKGDFELEFFAPSGKDYQTPHDRDEFYIIVNGTGQLIKYGVLIDCKPGDALFVEAGVEHHFENFTDDFAMWVIFF